MPSLEKKLGKTREEVKKVLKKIDVRNSKRKIKCASCDQFHKIKDLIAIQTHWYNPPVSCAAGDYWNAGELKFVCPETDVINRLLFFSGDEYLLSLEERREYNAEEQFLAKYKHLFRRVLDEYKDGNYLEFKEKGRKLPEADRPDHKKWVNNLYVDNHRKQFGLVEKLKKQK